MATTFYLKIDADGSKAFFLYSDKHPGRALGQMEMARASNVIWDEKDQKWKVEIWLSQIERSLLKEGFNSREEALKFEQEVLPWMLFKDRIVPEMFSKKEGGR